MSKHTNCFLHRKAAWITYALFMLGASPGITPVHAHPPDSKNTTEAKTKTDPDLVAVQKFFKGVDAAIKRDAQTKAPKGHDFERGICTLPTAWCVAKLGLPKDKPLEDCVVRDVSGRRAAVVMAVKDCGSETCDVDYWIVSDRSGLRPFPIELEHVPVVSPDRKYMFTGHTGMEPPKPGYIAYLTRITLKSLKTETIAFCAAPTLSPSGRWVVCRDASGHVHRLPIDGGRLEPVHTIDLGDDEINSDGHIGVSLHPVKFVKKDRMRIYTLTADDKEVIEEIKWTEGP